MALVVDQPAEQGATPQVLAALTNMHDSACWYLVDIRLRKHPAANEFSGSGRAEDFQAHYRPETEAQRALIKAMVREYKELEDGTVIWCTYLGLVAGEKSVDGYTPVNREKFHPPLYHSEERGLELLQDLRAFWERFEGRIEDSAIENPRGQPSESEVMHAVIRHQLAADRRASGNQPSVER